MQGFIKTITDWMLEKEIEAAKKGVIPMHEVEMQLQKLHKQKVKIQKQYDDAIEELNDVEKKLEKIRNIDILKGVK